MLSIYTDPFQENFYVQLNLMRNSWQVLFVSPEQRTLQKILLAEQLMSYNFVWVGSSKYGYRTLIIVVLDMSIGKLSTKASGYHFFFSQRAKLSFPGSVGHEMFFCVARERHLYFSHVIGHLNTFPKIKPHWSETFCT